MKNMLTILWTITLIGTSTISLVACNKIQEYTPEELAKLKEENKIKTNNQEIRDNLEWIARQEKPFNDKDNKWYYVVWKGNNQWNINKFKNDEFPKQIIGYNNKDRILINYKAHTVGQRPKELSLINKNGMLLKNWSEDIGIYFKYVYRWNLNTQEPDLIIDDKGNVKVNGE